MKIGILTFHSAHNYGAVLQAYGTQEYLRSQGHDAEIIDYRPHYIEENYKLVNLNRIFGKNIFTSLKKIVSEILCLKKTFKRRSAFEKFIEEKFYLSEKISNSKIPDSYDAYIFGSDQIWNPKITRGFDGIFFGDFAIKEHSRKIAYAASMEAIELTDEQKAFFRRVLSHMDSIGVRESHLKELLQPLTSKTIHTVLDPTLLLDSHAWEHILKKPNEEKKYVVVYQVRNNTETLKIAHSIAQEIGGIVVELVSKVTYKNKENRYQSASVEDFLGWIKHAACVVTTSFHGTVFSIIFERPFYTVKLSDGADSRSGSLLESLNLSERLISPQDRPAFSTIDYSDTTKKMKIIRETSASFLRDALIKSS